LVLWDHRDQRAALAILVYQDKMERKDHRAEQEIKVLQAWLESLAWMECEVQKVTMESQDHQAMMDERAVLDRWVLQDLLEQWWKGRRYWGPLGLQEWMVSQVKLEGQDRKENVGPVEIRVKEGQQERMDSQDPEVFRENREELVRLVWLDHRVTRESKVTQGSWAHLEYKEHQDLRDSLDNKELPVFLEILDLLVGRETRVHQEQMVRMVQMERTVLQVLQEIVASQEKMVALEYKALQGPLVPLGRLAHLVFLDTRDPQASKEIQGCLVQRVNGDIGDPPDLREIWESLVLKDQKGLQENRVIPESQGHKDQQELMEERDQGVLMAKQAEWDHRVSLEWKESQDSQVHQAPLDPLETQLLWPQQLCREAVSLECLEHLDQGDHQGHLEAVVPVVAEDLKEGVGRLVRTELLGVQEDRDCQEGQAVLDNQERVVCRVRPIPKTTLERSALLCSEIVSLS